MSFITVRYFASIRETLGRSEDRIEAVGVETALTIWQRVAGGTSLPPQALARLGTVRFRHAAEIIAVAFAPDGLPTRLPRCSPGTGSRSPTSPRSSRAT